jgi:nucleotide-binding universal stress UspA family protein
VLEQAGVHASVTILTGEPTEQLLAFAIEHSPDLVVMGTRGLTGLSRLKVGSTAGVVAHSTHHSVLLACHPGQTANGR